MKELIIENQSIAWIIIGGIFIVVSLVRRSYYPILGFALFSGGVFLKASIEEGELKDIIQNLLYISVGITLTLGYSFAMTGFSSKYLTPRDELSLIIYGVIFSIPGALFFLAEIEWENAYSYLLFTGSLGVIMLIFSRKIDKLLENNEEAYLEDTNSRIQEIGLSQLKDSFGDVSLSEMKKKVEDAFDRKEMTEEEYFDLLMEMHLIHKDYESAIIYAKEHNKTFRSDQEITNMVIKNSYTQALSEEALGNMENAFEHYALVEVLSKGNFYYATYKFEKLKPTEQ